MNKERHKKNLVNSEFYDNEDVPVLDFFDTIMKGKFFELLEVGSGLCRFVDKIRLKYPNIECTCLDINNNLSEIARKKGYKHINEDILKNSIPSNSFDLVHCSHVIEHFTFSEVTRVVDEILRITKKGGYCIIRSPLMSEFFYYDIDHIRPYPPEAILSYLNNPQQQKMGENKVQVISLWYRTAPKKIRMIDKSSYWYLLIYMRIPVNKFLLKLNKKIENLWNKYRFPATKPTGYVIILEKLY